MSGRPTENTDMPKQERLSEHEKAVLAEYQQGIRDIQQQYRVHSDWR